MTGVGAQGQKEDIRRTKPREREVCKRESWRQTESHSRFHRVEVEIVHRDAGREGHDTTGAELEQHTKVLEIVGVGVVHQQIPHDGAGGRVYPVQFLNIMHRTVKMRYKFMLMHLARRYVHGHSPAAAQTSATSRLQPTEYWL